MYQGVAARMLQGVTHGKVERLCSEGDRHVAAGEHTEALACFIEAWELLPPPREHQASAGRVMRGFARLARERRDLAPGLRLMLGAQQEISPALTPTGDAFHEDTQE